MIGHGHIAVIHLGADVGVQAGGGIRLYLHRPYVLDSLDAFLDSFSVERGPVEIHRSLVVGDLYAVRPPLFVAPFQLQRKQPSVQLWVELRRLETRAARTFIVACADRDLIAVEAEIDRLALGPLRLEIRLPYPERNRDQPVVVDVVGADVDASVDRTVPAGVEVVGEEGVDLELPVIAQTLAFVCSVVLIRVYRISRCIQTAVHEGVGLPVARLPLDVAPMPGRNPVPDLVLVSHIIDLLPRKPLEFQAAALCKEKVLVQALPGDLLHRNVLSGDYHGRGLHAAGKQGQFQRYSPAGDEFRGVGDTEAELAVGIRHRDAQLREFRPAGFVHRIVAGGPEVARPGEIRQRRRLIAAVDKGRRAYPVGSADLKHEVEPESSGAVLPHDYLLALRKPAGKVTRKKELPAVLQPAAVQFPVRLEHRLRIEFQAYVNLAVPLHVEVGGGVPAEEETVNHFPVETQPRAVHVPLELKIGQQPADTTAADPVHSVDILLRRVPVVRHQHSLPVFRNVEHEILEQAVFHGAFIVADRNHVRRRSRLRTLLSEGLQQAVGLTYVHAAVPEGLQVGPGYARVVYREHELRKQALHPDVHRTFGEGIHALAAPAHGDTPARHLREALPPEAGIRLVSVEPVAERVHLRGSGRERRQHPRTVVLHQTQVAQKVEVVGPAHRQADQHAASQFVGRNLDFGRQQPRRAVIHSESRAGEDFLDAAAETGLEPVSAVGIDV